MTYSYSLHDSVSPWMILSSVALHLVFFAAAVVLCGTLVKPTKLLNPGETVTKVTIMDSVPGPDILEKPALAAAPKPVEPVIEEAPSVEEAPKVSEATQETIKPKAVELPKTVELSEVVKQKKPKTKREPKKIEDPPKTLAVKPPKDKQPKEKPPKKKEDTAAILAQRLEDLKERVKQKEAAAAQAKSPDTAGSGRAGRSGTSEDNFDRWILEVKNRINDNWSILADTRDTAVTKISLQIEDNGAVKKAVVDEGSGDKSFDLSAMRAIMQASPFPPMPADVRDKINKAGKFGMRFTIKGAQ
jgi:TonB family protein